MSKGMYSVGSLLKEKNALLSYIYRDGSKIGAVVGTRGRDADHPLVGWCLFEEVGADVGRRETTIGSFAPLHDAMDVLESEVVSDTAKDIVGFLKGLTIVPFMSNPTEEQTYGAVEIALLRTNSNRENFFVSNNRTNGQCGSELRPDTGKSPVIVLMNGSTCDDEDILTMVRRGVRAMEYRAWRYFGGNR